jgi:hypothetical protein
MRKASIDAAARDDPLLASALRSEAAKARRCRR